MEYGMECVSVLTGILKLVYGIVNLCVKYTEILHYHYKRVKYKAIYFFDDSLPLDDELVLKDWGFQH